MGESQSREGKAFQSWDTAREIARNQDMERFVCQEAGSLNQRLCFGD